MQKEQFGHFRETLQVHKANLDFEYLPNQKRLPLVPGNIAGQIATDLENPRQFLGYYGENMLGQNPVFLEASLMLALQVMKAQGQGQAITSVLAPVYFNECFSRTNNEKGISLPHVTIKSIQNAQSNPLFGRVQSEDLRFAKIRGINPELYPGLSKIISLCRLMGSTDSFIEQMSATIEVAYNSFLIQSWEKAASKTEKPQKPKSPALPEMDRNIVRAALLRIIVDRGDFINLTLSQFGEINPEMVNKLRSTAGVDDNSQAYLLGASLMIYCFSEAYTRADKLIPKITADFISLEQRELMRVYETGADDLTTEATNNYKLNALKDLNDNYSFLGSVFERLALAMGDQNQRDFSAFTMGAFHSFLTIKGKTEADYLQELTDL